jgi:hypothetical protein
VKGFLRTIALVSAYLNVILWALVYWGQVTCKSDPSSCAGVLGFIIFDILFLPGSIAAPFLWFSQQSNLGRNAWFYLNTGVVLISTLFVLYVFYFFGILIVPNL